MSIPHLHECGEALLQFTGSEVSPGNIEHQVSVVSVEALLQTAFILGGGGGVEGRGGGGGVEGRGRGGRGGEGKREDRK